MDNPYSAPSIDSIEEIPSPAPSASLGSIARETFLAWEKLRLIYIAILATLTVLLGLLDVTNVLLSGEFWFTVVGGAMIANVCFFAGPIMETYVTWLGLRATWLRTTMFTLGTFLSCLLAFAAVAPYLLPDMV